jgi:hypothetical protein
MVPLDRANAGGSATGALLTSLANTRDVEGEKGTIVLARLWKRRHNPFKRRLAYVWTQPTMAMYLFLFAFGAVLSVAGLVLAASGLSVHDHTIDGSLMTSGIIAVVGGLLLIGLAFALRLLQRIEQVLAMPLAAPRAVRASETPEPVNASAAAAKPPGGSLPTPTPVKITRLPQTVPVGTHTPFSSAADKHVDDLPQKFPSIVRAGPAPPAEEIDPVPRPFAPAAVSDHDASDVENVGPFVPRKARNGAASMSTASAARVPTRLDARARAPLSMERPKSPAFDALWPKGPRSRRAAAQAAAVEVPEIPAVAPPPVIEEQGVEPPAVTPEDIAEPLTVLKSGVVDGMAYTLYSDGSIEAQLPQGTLRFGSIAELRAHIEQDAQS